MMKQPKLSGEGVTEDFLLYALGVLFMEWGDQRIIRGDKSLEVEVVSEAITWLVRVLGLIKRQGRAA